ncbi:MAG: FadR family transcriptional regulator [Rhodospirillales bacterium]|jgi:GntR family transcriptional regulator, transcriptional repressor for pyruvate dehydrogenase complex|nr:FadR family transcriptional regulator [Rhodospirillales bacterium]
MKLQIGQVGRTLHLPTRVAELISTEISEGRLAPGDRLPTEHELAETCGVSRTVVREAIARLRSDGVIDTRQGVGAFVNEPSRRSTLRIDAAALRDRDSIESLFELRGLLEIETAGLAAVRHARKHLRAMERSIRQMRETEHWSEEGVVADLDFHHAVAAASGNPYVDKFVVFLSEHMRETIVATRKNFELKEIVDITINEHVAILEAIAAKDWDLAREAMRTHVKGAAGRLGIDVCTRPGLKMSKNQRMISFET